MKTTHFMAIMASCLALAFMGSRGFALQANQPASNSLAGAAGGQASAGPAPAQAEGKPQSEGERPVVRHRLPAAGKHNLKTVIPAKPNRTNSNPARVAPAPANTVNAQPQRSGASGGGPSAAFIERETSKSGLPVRPPGVSVIQAAAPPLNLRHRDPNLPVVGGAANPHAKNTGTIDGAHMGRKP